MDGWESALHGKLKIVLRLASVHRPHGVYLCRHTPEGRLIRQQQTLGCMGPVICSSKQQTWQPGRLIISRARLDDCHVQTPDSSSSSPDDPVISINCDFFSFVRLVVHPNTIARARARAHLQGFVPGSYTHVYLPTSPSCHPPQAVKVG